MMDIFSGFFKIDFFFLFVLRFQNKISCCEDEKIKSHITADANNNILLAYLPSIKALIHPDGFQVKQYPHEI